MQPLPDWLSFSTLAIGIVLNLIGLAFGVRAYFLTWGAYGDGALFPRVAACVRRTRAFVRKLMFWRKPLEPVSVSMIASAVCGAFASATVVPGFPDVADDAARFGQLQQAIEMAFRQMSEDRGRVNRLESDLVTKIATLDGRVSEEARRLESVTRNVAAGSVRAQIWGLILVATGTSVAAFPSLWAALMLVTS